MSRFDETIKKMQNITNEIKVNADKKIENADEETKAKIKAVSDKTIDTINEASVKLKNVVDQIDNEEELNKFLDRVEEKCTKAAKFAYSKFDEIVPEAQAEFIKIEDDTKSTMEKFMDNENVKSAINMATKAKDSVVDFINSPETQKTIKNAKMTALNVADKGLDALIKILDKAKDSTEKAVSKNEEE